MAAAQALEKIKDSFGQDTVASEAIRCVSQCISSHDLPILKLIEALEADFLHPVAEHRARAVLAIAQVLEHLLPDFKALNDKEIELLAEFFCSKLKDHHSLLPATLQGLNVLSKTPRLPQGFGKTIVQSIFQDVHCQSQLQSDRRKIYVALKNLLTTRLEELQSLGQNFVFGLIQAADQERDPRNLLILFSLFPVVAKYFQLEPFTEEFFEVFSCYFPIDFSPSPDDPYGITKEQLSDGLRYCLASSPQFAEYAFPLLQEKLDSDLESAKIEALKALEVCCENYGPSQLQTWADSIWKSIRREVLINVNGDELEHAALDALTAMSRCLTIDGKTMSSSFENLAQDILTECKGHLCEPERRLMTPSSYVLLAVCAGSPPACKMIVNQVIPLLIDQYRSRPQSTPRQFILNTLNKMVHAGLYGFSKETVLESAVDQFVPTLFDLYASILNEGDAVLRSLSLLGLSYFLGIRMESAELERIDAILFHMLQTDDLKDIVVQDIGKFLSSAAHTDESWVTQKILPKLVNMIHGDKYERAIDILCSLPVTLEISSVLVPQLLELLESSKEMDLLSGVIRVLGRFSQKGDPQLFDRLHSWALNATIENRAGVRAICSILRDMSAAFLPEQAAAVLEKEADSYLKSHLSSTNQTIFIMEAVIGSLNAVPSGSCLFSLAESLKSIALESTDDEVRISADRLISALVNKTPEGPELEQILDDVLKSVKLTDVNKKNAIDLFIWIAKALVMRAYSKSSAWIDELVQSLNDPQFGYEVAEGFKTLLSDTTECLNIESHANIRLMYRQRFFQEVVPKLLDLYRKQEFTNKAACFAAIANQLAFIPHGVLLSQITTLIPLLIQCLVVEQPDQLITSTIDALISLMSENTTVIVDYIDSLVPRLLALAKNSASLHVRKLALKCLAEIRKAPQIALLPVRAQVVSELVHCLGDKKRLVRREAALARHKWIMLGQPGGY